MKFPTRQNWLGYLVASSGVILVTTFYHVILTTVTTTTVALNYLLVVLITSLIGGLGPGILASVLGVLLYDYFFLPSIGKFIVQDPQNIIDFLVFLITAVVTSQLSASARERARDAEKSREEVWRLYQLSRGIIATSDSDMVISSIARQVREIFEIDYCAIFVPAETGRWHRLNAVTEIELNTRRSFKPEQQMIDRVLQTGEIQQIKQPASASDQKKAQQIIYTPLKVTNQPDGVMVLISPVLSKNTIDAIAGLVALALERAHFLQQVSHAEALKQSDSLKSAILASVSHNLRTPLTSIRASIDNLLQEDFTWDSDSLREFHTIISEETYRLTQIVQNLLEMARIDAGELHPIKQWNVISELFGDLLDRCASVLRNHQIDIEIDENLPSIQFDPQLISEVVANLLENAAKYSPAGSHITLAAHLHEKEFTISVKDQGAGIRPDELEHIFDKFYRGTQLSGGGIEGTGMGLAIARGIVEAHGGTIWAESEVGQGTTFFINLTVECQDAKEFTLIDGEL